MMLLISGSVDTKFKTLGKYKKADGGIILMYISVHVCPLTVFQYHPIGRIGNFSKYFQVSITIILLIKNFITIDSKSK